MNTQLMRNLIETERLVIFPFTLESLSLFNSDLAAFEEKFGVVYRGEELDYLLRDYLKRLESELAADPANALFFTEFLIVLRENSHVIGSIDYKYPPKYGITEVGYGLNPAYRGRGYMTEALSAFLRFGRSVGLRAVLADTAPDNLKSQAVLKRCGFRFIKEDKNLWWRVELYRRLRVNGREFEVTRFLGRGKGGYSYLVRDLRREYVLKEIHHEPCSFYSFGNKLESELRDYKTLTSIGIPMPALVEVDTTRERILKDFVDGPVASELIRSGRMTPEIFAQVRQMAEKAKSAGLNIDYYPTNFVLQDGRLYYIDYECNPYMEKWDFDNWGEKHWKNAVLYVHGKGGSADESEHYKALFPDCDLIGLDYKSELPWKAGEEIRSSLAALRAEYGGVMLIANSIGAYYCLFSGCDMLVSRAFFISPVVDMEAMILGMMKAAGVTEAELREKGEIETPTGTLSWEYLSRVRSRPIRWNAPTEILCGSRDALVPLDSVREFCKAAGAGLTLMENGEHWFHTPEQMDFLDAWIREKREIKTV